MYREITKSIQVDVEPSYIPERSRPESGFYFFAYRIKIKNLGKAPAQLLSRHWIITDGHGKTEEVKGPGVVGAQPKLSPGEEFEYSSFCPLATPTGNMRGVYRMIDETGGEFEVRVPLFFLRDLSVLH